MARFGVTGRGFESDSREKLSSQQGGGGGGGGGTLAGVFTPETYGAVGDGSTDDSVALNACMTAVRAYGKGGTMWLSKLYKHQGPLNLSATEGAKVVGAGGRKNIQDTGPGLLFTGGTGTGSISSLTAAITSTSTTSISASPVPTYMGDGGFMIQIDSEYMWVYNGASTGTWTVRRGIRDSSGATHSNSAPILPAYGAIIAGTPQGFTLENLFVSYNNAAFTGDLVDIDWYPFPQDPTNFDVTGCAFTGTTGVSGAASLVRLNHAIIGRVTANHFGTCTGPAVKLGDGDYCVGVQVRDNTFNSGHVGSWCVRTSGGCEAILIEGNTFEPIAGTYAGAWQHANVNGGVAWHVTFRNNWTGDESSDSQAWVEVDAQLNSATIANNRFAATSTGNVIVNFGSGAAGQVSINDNFCANGNINFAGGSNVNASFSGNNALNAVTGTGTSWFNPGGAAASMGPGAAHPTFGIGTKSGQYSLDINPQSGPPAGVSGDGIRLINGKLFFGGTDGNQDATVSIGTANLIGLRLAPGQSNAIVIPTWSGYNFAAAMSNGDSALFYSQDGSAMHPRFMAVNASGASQGPFFMGMYLQATGTWNPGTVANGATATTTVSVSSAVVGQPVNVGLSTITVAGLQLSGSVTSSGTVTVTLTNQSGSSQTIGSGTVNVQVWQH